MFVQANKYIDNMPTSTFTTGQQVCSQLDKKYIQNINHIIIIMSSKIQ